MLLRNLQEIIQTNDTRSAFIIVRAFTSQRSLNPGVKEIIINLVQHNLNKNINKLTNNDLTLSL